MHRFSGNISKSSSSIFRGLQLIVKNISTEYKSLVDVQTYFVEGKEIDEEVLANLDKIDKIDAKLIVLIKFMEKSK